MQSCKEGKSKRIISQIFSVLIDFGMLWTVFYWREPRLQHIYHIPIWRINWPSIFAQMQMGVASLKIITWVFCKWNSCHSSIFIIFHDGTLNHDVGVISDLGYQLAETWSSLHQIMKSGIRYKTRLKEITQVYYKYISAAHRKIIHRGVNAIKW